MSQYAATPPMEGLYVDGDALFDTTIGDNLGDAVSWLLFIVPSMMMPLGILGAALVTLVVRAIGGAGRSALAVVADQGMAGR